jgi:hypothetical protein
LWSGEKICCIKSREHIDPNNIKIIFRKKNEKHYKKIVRNESLAGIFTYPSILLLEFLINMMILIVLNDL